MSEVSGAFTHPLPSTESFHSLITHRASEASDLLFIFTFQLRLLVFLHCVPLVLFFAISSLQFYWLPHESLVWVPARVIENEGGIITYETIYNETLTHTGDKYQPTQLERVSETSMKVPGISNLVNLDEFGEGAVVHQLRERYKHDLIYTNIGSILVSCNPYCLLPLYSSAQVDAYHSAAKSGPITLSAMDPHVYQIAAEAYQKLYDDDDATVHNQAVIISGESGAGSE